MFAAASGTAVGRIVEFKAVLQNYSIVHVRCDVGVHACLGRRTRFYLEPPLEEIEEHGDCVWSSNQSDQWSSQGCKDRGAGATLIPVLRSEEARQRGFTVESHPKCPTLCYVREADGVIELHVDD